MKLLVGPLDEVATICAAHRPSHLVSWLSPPAEAPEVIGAFAPRQRLLLESHDVIELTEGFQAPSADDVGRLIAFAREWDRARPMLVHCWAGVSRSTAAAFVVACALSARPERELAQALRRASPSATPNPLIIRHADELLGRDGRMIQAVAEIGRGAECMLGAPFELRPF